MNIEHIQEINKKYYNCPNCYLQSSFKEELENHISIKHTDPGQVADLKSDPKSIAAMSKAYLVSAATNI